MKVDKEGDALFFCLNESAIVESEEVRPGVILDFDQEMFNELIDLFLEEVPGRMAELHTAVEAEDAKQIHAIAHNIKGASYPFGAAAFAGVAKELELIGRSGELEGAGDVHHQLVAAFDKLIIELEDRRANG